MITDIFLSEDRLLKGYLLPHLQMLDFSDRELEVPLGYPATGL